MGSGSSVVRHPYTVDIYRSQSFYRTVDDIPAVAYTEQRVLQCHVTYVVDGDSLRCRHIPVAPHGSGKTVTMKKTQHPMLDATALDLEEGKLRNETILVRVAGIDAPEAANAKGPGQPFAEESTACVKQHCLHSAVFIKLLNKDQYGRPLVRVLISAHGASLDSSGGQRETRNPLKCLARLCGRSPPELSHPKDLGELLLERGLAVVYYGRGAEYDGQKHVYEQRMREAQRDKRGIWSLTQSELEVPGAYKRKLLATATAQPDSSMPRKNLDQEKPLPEANPEEAAEVSNLDSQSYTLPNCSRRPKRRSPQGRKDLPPASLTGGEGPIVWQGWHHQDSINSECEDFNETWNSVPNRNMQQNNPSRLQPASKKKKKKRQRRNRGRQRH